MAFTTQITKGQYILFNQQPHHIVEKEFVSPGKGSAFTRVKMQNLVTGSLVAFTFKSGEKVNQIEVNINEYQYLYNENSLYTFMDNTTYEQISLPKEAIGSFTKLIKEGENYLIMIYDNNPIGFKTPLKVVREIVKTTDTVKGNSATDATKKAILDVGYELDVPMFIQVGDKVSVNTQTGKYSDRVTN